MTTNIEKLLKVEEFTVNVWDCACGNGEISKALEKEGYNVFKTDDAVKAEDALEVDFLSLSKKDVTGDFSIITCPPDSDAEKFARKALELIDIGNRVAMFLKLDFLGTELCKTHSPHFVYTVEGTEYAWFIWDKYIDEELVVRWLDKYVDEELVRRFIK